MSGLSDLTGRIDDLESRLAFQDDLIESLNEVVARQDQEMVRLRQRLESLEAKLDDLSTVAPGSTESHEVPPHY